MSRFLARMGERSRLRADSLARERPLEEMREAARSAPPPRRLGSFGSTFDVIAEIKPRSPAEGSFAGRSATVQAQAYQEGGAAMISVLAEPSEFGGSVRMVAEVSRLAFVPVLAKDFLVDPIQVFEAREAGAGGVLLIARMLDDRGLSRLLDTASECGCFTLLEAFDREDLDRISRLSGGREDVLVGVNCRDLDTLEVVPSRHAELADRLPDGQVAVAESAVTSSADIERVCGLGYRAALVGTALMRADQPGSLVGELVTAGRRVASVPS
jgi:indole-3-glycerol phosphate synthase